MAFPNDLDDVAQLKVHPAIGVARLANNDDFYEFFEFQILRDAGRATELEYMSLKGGRHWMKRQAVRFKIFAYDAGGAEVGELTDEVLSALGLRAIWSASVANRKLHNWSGGQTAVVSASARAGRGDRVELEGDNPWREEKVWFGTLSGDGLFIPSKGGVHRQNDQKRITPFGTHQRDNGVLDTTCDGAITVAIEGGAAPPVVPACVLVAPQDHSPDVRAAEINNPRNIDFIQSTRELLAIGAGTQGGGVGAAMDVAMMDTVNGEYSPGMELCLNPTDALPDPARAFYPRGQGAIGTAEIRPSYEPGHADHGALTAGLCSTWQTDLNACLDYWTAEYPFELDFDEPPETRKLARQVYTQDGPLNNDPEFLNAFIDMMGVGRKAADQPGLLFERERGVGDDAGAAPQAPYPLDPPR